MANQTTTSVMTVDKKLLSMLRQPFPNANERQLKMLEFSFNKIRPCDPDRYNINISLINLHRIHFFLVDLAMRTRSDLMDFEEKDATHPTHPELAKLYLIMRRVHKPIYLHEKHLMYSILLRICIPIKRRHLPVLEEEVRIVLADELEQMTLVHIHRAIKPTIGEIRFKTPDIKQDFHAGLKYNDRFEKFTLFMAKHYVLDTAHMRYAHYLSVKILPYYLVDFRLFRDHEYRMLPRIAAIIGENITQFDRRVMDEWYTKIMVFFGDKMKMSKLSTVKRQHLINLVNQYIKEQLVFMKDRTIKLALECLQDPAKCPLVDLRIAYTGRGRISLIPTYSRVIQLFVQIVTKINRAGVLFLQVESFLYGEAIHFIPTERDKEYLSMIVDTVIRITVKLLAPVMEHIRNLEKRFQPLISADHLIAYEEFRRVKQPMEDLAAKIAYYKQLHTDLLTLPNFEYIATFRVNQSELIGSLMHLCQRYTTDLLLELSLNHVTEIVQFSVDFTELNKFSMIVPTSTAQLIAMGKYMTWATTKMMQKKRLVLARLVAMGIKIIEYHEMLTDHMQLLANAIWDFKNSYIIFDNYSSMFEAIKYEMEERMHNTADTLTEYVKEFIGIFEVYEGMSTVHDLRENIKIATRLADAVDSFYPIIEWINAEEVLYNMPKSIYPDVNEYRELTYGMLKLLWMVQKWYRTQKLWMDGEFTDLNIDDVEECLEVYYKFFLQLQKLYKSKIKNQISEDDPKRFKGFVDDPDFNSWPTPLQFIHNALQSIKAFRVHVPLVSILSNPAMTERHWIEMSEIIGYDISPTGGTSLRTYINMNLDPILEKFEIISVGATKEKELQENMKRMMAEWENLNFTISTFKDTGLPILTAVDEVQAIVEDHLVKTLTMRGSAFVKPVEEMVREWYNLLVTINLTIEEMGKVQISWLYFMPIFSSKDIVAQMPEEGALFVDVDQIFRSLMKTIQKDPSVKNNAGNATVLPAMLECSEKLDLIFIGVNNYLEKKRLYFPRFFFLSNEEMLEILSETKDPLRVQPHLKKCFEGINKLGLDSELVIHSMYSGEGEIIEMVKLISTAEARGSVEKWLLQVEEDMILSVRNEIYRSMSNYSIRGRSKWVQEWPGQVVLCVAMITWTNLMEDVLCRDDYRLLGMYHEGLNTQLKALIELVRGKLSKLTRITLGALVVLDVHAKDVTYELYEKRIDKISDFEWQSQLRYYIEDEVYVRLTNATVPYAYEYLGNTPRLVITPLTDRCYRTLIGAYHLHLNGAPEGPAGTGKTETTKDLAKALAVQCVVFNCSDGLDYIAMGKFFKGLAAAGAWACFDEFNRIEIEVLSVIAQQILCIVQAIRNHLDTFMFEGTLLTLNPNCYVCITMNPGYAGRSELPDNLKVLFRTVAMMVPDYAMIGEISLYSYGFISARTLSVKIVTTYRLCSEQLSSQFHYDYGMRAVKSVLTAAGNLKQKFPKESEDILLLRSILDVNLPKFLHHDVPLFNGIISDLFPGVVLPQPNYDLLIEAISGVCNERNLQAREYFITKIIQTYEMMIVRHGFMLVGDPFGGKTSVLHVLADALTYLKKSHNVEDITYFDTMNPKAVTLGQLYGQYDLVSHDWTDGILAKIYRIYAQTETDDRKWVIFDGPVDAVWIENMNTVLDDNKKLCLNSGEVIQMSNSMSIIFEVMDLMQASPATVSRCGMIYLEPSTLGWRPLAESWNNTLPEMWKGETGDRILQLFDWFIPPSINFINKRCRRLINGGVSNSVWSTMNLMEGILKKACEETPDTKYANTWVLGAFLLSLVWGVGGTLDEASMEKFDGFIHELWEGGLDPHPTTIDPDEIPLPIEGVIHDYVYIFKGKGQWKYWPEIVKGIKFDETANEQFFLVPTLETAKYLYILELNISCNRPFLLVGPTGTGKSFYIQNMLMTRISLNKFLPAFITFTTFTSANFLQEMILSKMVKIKKGRYGGHGGKTCVMFVDDVNLPMKEQYGAIPACELIRQYFDHGNWFDLKETYKILVKDILFISAMGPPGGSRQELYQRFLRHFHLYAIHAFSDESLSKIFTSQLFFGWRKGGFATDIMITVNYIITATLRLFKAASSNLLPTPAKSHYLFNSRDFARVIIGHLLLRKESAESKRVFVRLWVHEVMRIFYDRLVDNADRAWLFRCIKDTVKDCFKENFDSMMDKLEDNPDNREVSEDALRNLIFTTALDNSEEIKKYEEIPTIEAFYNVAVNSLEEYNSSHKTKMTIVLFRYALEHLSKIVRVLSMPNGNALLVGVGGSGRQSLTRLAACIHMQSVYQPEITKNYGLNEWRDDLKRVLRESGGRNKPTVFLVAESQIKEDYFLQDIDALLNSGEVPNIFPIDEQQEIIEMVRLAAQGGNRNIDISPQMVIFFFIYRCKLNLHIVLCFSPIGSSFRTRLRLYPSLVNCCTIDWYEGWPEDALEKVAKEYLKTVTVSDAIKVEAVKVCKYFHVSTRIATEEYYNKLRRRVYITSASYLDLIKSYSQLITAKQEEVLASKMRYIGGLDKLLFAAGQVAIMQKDLEALQPQLKIAAAETSQMLQIIERETAEVEKASDLVKKDEQIANVQAEAAIMLKTECENDLALAIPILEDALGALNTLKPTDITLVKSMKNPPDAVKLVMAAVCVMRDIKPDKVPDPNNPGRKIFDYWGPSKRLLGDISFLQQLREYDKDNIPAAVMMTIRKQYLPHKDFKPEIVAKASSAAEGLCKWVIAMDKYDVVAKEVAPKKAKLEIAEREFAATMDLLNSKRAQVKALEEKLELLNVKLQDALEKKKKLQEEVRSCSMKLEYAKKIIGSLGGERDRWSKAAQDLQLDHDCLPGDILISCGIIAYLAPFEAHTRQRLTEEWITLCRSLNIPMSKSYSLTGILGSNIKIQAWNIHGLPRDSFSIENAVIQEWSKRWSLLIDPQGQANKWIKQMEKEVDMATVKLIDDNYMKQVEAALEYGKPVLIEGVGEDLDPPLDPILHKHTFVQGGRTFITLGENVMEFSPNFRLYITTKLRNPHYLPEIFNKVTIINFAITLDGLSDQLLGIVVSKDRPDLQEKREVLIVQGARNRRALKETEDKILETLSSVKGNILEDETAVNILDSSKALSREISAKEEAAKETQVMIEEFRLKYKPVADHCAGLYYTITDLPMIDPMYQFSLAWFINIFTHAVDNSRKSKIITERILAIQEVFNYALYMNVCRSLFDKDKLLYSFILCTTLMANRGELDQREFNFLLTGSVGVEEKAPNPWPRWLPDKSWEDICALDRLDKFAGIKMSVSDKNVRWEEFYLLNMPQGENLPLPWTTSLSNFEKLVLIKMLRPDQFLTLVQQLIVDEIGEKFTKPPMFDIMGCFHDSNFFSPIIFILSSGIDPMQSLLLFANKMDFAEQFFYISLGQGQGPRAQAMIEQAQKQGSWVCLQNCHLAASWMPILEKICEGFDVTNTHPDFRLWLTSYPSEQFPSALLQNGVKITNEPPTGLKENILRCYTADPVNDSDFYYSCGENKNAAFSKLLFGITFFHTVILERKKYGPIGWNVPYGFNDSDYLISIQQLQMYITESAELPIVAVLYLSGECNYGGRVTDAWDRRTLNTLLADYVNLDIVNNPTYELVRDDNRFVLPARTSYKDVVKYIEKLPTNPTPEVFGLHNNAGITRNFNETRQFMESLITVKGEAMSSEGGGQDEVANLLASDILSRLPSPFEVDVVLQKYPTQYSESMNTVLVQEMERFNKMIVVLHSTLANVQKAIKGLLVMSSDLEAVFSALITSRVPRQWTQVSYPSLKPLGSYISDFFERLAYLQKWYDVGKPTHFWISGFYFTQAFLTGAMQNYARKYTIPIDILTYDFEVIPQMSDKDQPEDGVYVYGMYLEGARWNTPNNMLEEQEPKILYEKLPLLWIKPLLRSALKDRGRYICPLYKTSERRGVLSTTGHSTNYVLPVMLESGRLLPSHWIKRGVALLCQLDD